MWPVILRSVPLKIDRNAFMGDVPKGAGSPLRIHLLLGDRTPNGDPSAAFVWASERRLHDHPSPRKASSNSLGMAIRAFYRPPAGQIIRRSHLENPRISINIQDLASLVPIT